jgi:hypothetical protein
MNEAKSALGFFFFFGTHDSGIWLCDNFTSSLIQIKYRYHRIAIANITNTVLHYTKTNSNYERVLDILCSHAFGLPAGRYELEAQKSCGSKDEVSIWWGMLLVSKLRSTFHDPGRILELRSVAKLENVQIEFNEADHSFNVGIVWQLFNASYRLTCTYRTPLKHRITLVSLLGSQNGIIRRCQEVIETEHFD